MKVAKVFYFHNKEKSNPLPNQYRKEAMIVLSRKISINSKLVFLLITLIYNPAISHNGGLDKNGGHNDRKNGGYHCHKEPCFSTHKQARDAIEEAVKNKREFSFIYRREDWKHWSAILTTTVSILVMRFYKRKRMDQ